jgi:hypothetical protein
MRYLILMVILSVNGGPASAKVPDYDYQAYRNCGLTAVFLSTDPSASPAREKAYKKQAIALNRKALKLSMKGRTLDQAVAQLESEAPGLVQAMKNDPSQIQATKADCIAKKLIKEVP